MELLKGYQSQLVSFFENMLFDQRIPEDLAQETFGQVWEARNGYQPTTKFSTWLFGIADDLVINPRRKRAIRLRRGGGAV